MWRPHLGGALGSSGREILLVTEKEEARVEEETGFGSGSKEGATVEKPPLRPQYVGRAVWRAKNDHNKFDYSWNAHAWTKLQV